MKYVRTSTFNLFLNLLEIAFINIIIVSSHG